MLKSLRNGFSLITTLLILHLYALTVFAQPPAKSPAPSKCEREASEKLGFFPRAITLTPVNVRAQLPEYSFLKGQWILGQIVDRLPQDTCIAIIEKRDVGVIQIWYLVKYKRGDRLRSGWVWGGTKDVDDTLYVGGDKTPERQGEQSGSWGTPSGTVSMSLLTNVAYAQADFVPGRTEGQFAGGASDLKDEKAVEYYVSVPLVGWSMSVSTLSAIILFFAMVVGMFAKAVWDQTESGNIAPPLVKIIRPLLISPIAFSAFWGPMYLQQGNIGISLTMALYAFQIGFMWQHVLEKRIVPAAEEKR